ncbi:4-hydroxyphenylacetate 3-hydroxylase N-terminal domain-containing protein [Cupriavidus basilensis]|uniref:4-hydroxyphenylacetate 3-hydroxylase N-terminal domain-containing protein n=1 Tax=Cupriavidus basilensis TaxID=68895 RepID=UPI00157A5C0A|nr:4-hydroxyphenylacetate 3-hydroxylase N-terminal domain-containing protein [Cupriavidus basilensis]NUA31178.1 hypothetical protein [Cupriavidus basilensis]
MSNVLAFNGKYGGARKGSDFLQRLERRPPELWYQGKLVENIRNFEPIRNGVETLAALYDYQWSHSDRMLETFDGKKVSRSLSIPKEKSDLFALGKALLTSAKFSQGMLGREPGRPQI